MQIADIYLGNELAEVKPASRRSRGARPAAAPGERNLEDYVGDYYNQELSTTYTVVLRNGRLVVEHPRNRDVALSAVVRKDRFRGSAWWMRQVRFVRAEDGRVAEMLVSNGRVLNVRFARR